MVENFVQVVYQSSNPKPLSVFCIFNSFSPSFQFKHKLGPDFVEFSSKSLSLDRWVHFLENTIKFNLIFYASR
jgi:hypothetical protein